MGSFARSWALAKESWGVLKRYPGLSVFPLVSAVITVILSISFILPFVVVVGLKNLEHNMPPLGYVLTGIFYFLSYFVVIFFNCALVHCARKALSGQPTSFGDGMQAAGSRLGPILMWTLLAATVGWILNMISERAGLVGKIIIAIIGAAWNILTFFVIPVLVFEGVSPVEAIKRSGATMKKTWGEALIGNAGVGLAIFLLGFAAVPVIVLAAFTGSAVFILSAVALAVIWWLVLAAIGSSMSSIYRTAVYMWATSGTIPDGYTQDGLYSAFRSKPGMADKIRNRFGG